MKLHDNPDFMHEFDRATRAAMMPGPHLDDQNGRMAETLSEILDDLTSSISLDKPAQVPLYQWSRHIITMAASRGVFGDSNPYMDKTVEEAFW
jgi:hypothetical protein